MKEWLRRIGGAVLMSLAWAAAWAPVGVLFGMIVDPDDSMDEMWVLIGAYPGFLCGMVFSVMRWVAGGGRRFHALSLSRVGTLGAASGLLVGVLPFLIGTPRAALPMWLVAVTMIVPMILLSAVSAVGSALVLRRHPIRDPGPSRSP